LIVNAAAYTAVDKAESERDIAMAVNGEAPGIMASWAERHGAAILHYSTDYVFDGTGGTPWREDDPPSPINVYGETKRAGEIAVAGSGAPHLIIRTSWIYDAQGANFLRTILRLARERNSLQIVDDQVGAPTPAWWLAEVSARIAAENQMFVGDRGGLLHAAPAGRTSWHGFAEAIVEGARERGLSFAVEAIEPIPSSAYSTPATRPLSSMLSLDRLEKIFGVAPPPWRDALSPVLDEIAQEAD
jgi:dTDP-4-dehydrorhamnose reductase